MARDNVTIKDIAQSLNVSTTTVSKVLNGASDISEKMRARVLEKVAETGYVPNLLATNLRKARANLVALVLSDISKPYFGRVIAGYEATLSAAGYQTMTFSSMESGEREEHFLQMIASMNMAGIIIDPAQDSDPSKRALQQTGIPYVFSNRYLDSRKDVYVAADNVKAGYLATRHLLERKPGAPVFCVNGPNRISPTVTRCDGYRKAMEEAGAFKAWYVYNNCFGLEDAYGIGRDIAKKCPPPFSVFCNTDQFAIGVMRALFDVGLRVPEDVGVIGIDDIDSARFLHPALTTVALPKEQIGCASAQMLIRLMRGEALEERQILLEPELIIRETT